MPSMFLGTDIFPLLLDQAQVVREEEADGNERRGIMKEEESIDYE
jgi:hypothetical protein